MTSLNEETSLQQQTSLNEETSLQQQTSLNEETSLQQQTSLNEETYSFRSEIKISFPHNVKGALFGSEIYSLEQVGKFWGYLEEQNSRNTIYLLYALGVNYLNNLMRVLRVCKGSMFNTLHELLSMNIIQKVPSPEADDRVQALFKYLQESHSINYTSLFIFYELTPWARAFVDRNKEFFEKKITQSAYEEILQCNSALQSYLLEVKEERSKLQQEREEKESMSLEEREREFFLQYWEDATNLGKIYALDQQTKMYNRYFKTKLSPTEFLARVKIYKNGE